MAGFWWKEAISVVQNSIRNQPNMFCLSHATREDNLDRIQLIQFANTLSQWKLV